MQDFPKSLIHTLKCPQSGGALHLSSLGKLISDQTNLEYPVTDDIPWLYSHPEAQLYHWSQKFIQITDHLGKKLENIRLQLAQLEIHPASRSRLKILEKAYTFNQTQFLEIQKKLFQGKVESLSDELSIALAEGLSGTQHLNSYMSNIFRDWTWQTTENGLSLEACKNIFPKSQNQTLVVFGAGSCRLPVDLHNELNPQWTLAVDINPLLFYYAKSIIDEIPQSLYDFPLSPSQNNFVAVESPIHSEMKNVKNFFLIMADAMNPPFKQKSIDQIFTPWFVDIIPQTVEATIRKINYCLKPGGHWLNFGPLGYSFNNEVDQLSMEEIEALLPECGFELEILDKPVLPYLLNPYSQQQRHETVYAFRAKKINETKQPPRYHLWPDWLLDSRLKIPILQEIKPHLITRQIQFEVLNVIDGNRSIDDIAQLMVSHYKMTPDQAKSSLIHFFSILNLKK